MREKNRNSIASSLKLPQFTTMNVIDGQAGLVFYSSLIFYSLTIDNILNIIVLLILAEVSINLVTGGNGVLTQANNAVISNRQATAEEEVKMAWESATTKYWSDWASDSSKDILDYVNKDTLNQYISNTGNITLSEQVGKGYYIVRYKSNDQGDVYEFGVNGNGDIKSLEEAINSQNYGKKVVGYVASSSSGYSGDWRLFYQDSMYTYIITDTLVGEYRLSNYISSYENSSDVSAVGKFLNGLLFDNGSFNSNELNDSLKGVAYLTDIEVWKDYKDTNGKAIYAIGSPTVELYTNSFNAAAPVNNVTAINLELDENHRYAYNVVDGMIKQEFNNGIYNCGIRQWWISSPAYGDDANRLIIMAYDVERFGRFTVENIRPIRPVVCIPTDVFEATYTLE